MPRTIAIGTSDLASGRVSAAACLTGPTQTTMAPRCRFLDCKGEGVLSRGVPDLRALGVAGRVLDAG